MRPTGQSKLLALMESVLLIAIPEELVIDDSNLADRTGNHVAVPWVEMGSLGKLDGRMRMHAAVDRGMNP